MKQMNWLGAILRSTVAALAVVTLAHAADLVEGQDYQTLAQPQPVEVPGKVEVIEFFSFGCPHCNHYEPYVEAWAATLPRDAVFRREHVNFDGRTDWADYAKLAITLKAMGKLDIMAKRVFDAIHVQNLDFHDKNVLFPWVAKQGLDRAKFENIWDNSFSMDSLMARAQQLPADYHIDGVPEFVVNGKYLVQAAGNDPDGRKMFATINQLVERERHKTSNPSGAAAPKASGKANK